MLRLARFITSVNRWIGQAIAWAILPLFALLITDVLMRYFIGRPTTWTGELATMVFGVYAILGGGYLLAERGHVNVDIVYGTFSRRTKARVDIATSALFFLFVVVLLWQGWSLAADSVARWEASVNAWRGPIWPVKVAIPIAALLLLLQGIVRLINDILVATGHEVDERTFGKQAPADPDEQRTQTPE